MLLPAVKRAALFTSSQSDVEGGRHCRTDHYVVSVLSLKFRVVPHFRAITGVIEIKLGVRSTVLDDPGDALRIRVVKNLSICADQVEAAVQLLDQAGSVVVLAAVMRHFESVDLKPLRFPFL